LKTGQTTHLEETLQAFRQRVMAILPGSAHDCFYDNATAELGYPTHGALFRGGVEARIRKHLVDADLLDCVMGSVQICFMEQV